MLEPCKEGLMRKPYDDGQDNKNYNRGVIAKICITGKDRVTAVVATNVTWG